MSQTVSIRIGEGLPPVNRAALARLNQKSLPMFSIRKASKAWPDPALSIGRRCLSSNDGTVWEAVGPAQAAFIQIAKVIQDLLEANADYLDEGEEISPTFSYGLWMVGKQPANAVPTVILCCPRRPVRKRAESLIRTNGVLDPFPGIVLKTSSTTPRPLARGDSETKVKDEPVTLYTIGKPERSCGVSVLFSQVAGAPTLNPTLRKATIGGVVHLGHERYGMTVAHALCDGVDAPLPSLGHEDYIHFDSDSESESEDGSFLGGTSQDSVLTPDESIGEDLGSSSGFQVTPSNLLAHSVFWDNALRMGSLHLAGNSSQGYQQDWALFKIKPDWPQDNNRVSLPEGKIYATEICQIEASKTVAVATGREFPTGGQVSHTPTFIRTQGSQRFSKLWAISLDDPLVPGDCGSWVLDSADGHLVGVVVAGLPLSRLAYLVDSKQLFNDISQTTGTQPKLSAGSVSQSPTPFSQAVPYSGPYSGRLIVRVTNIEGLGLVREPYMVISVGQSEYVAHVTRKSIQIPVRSGSIHDITSARSRERSKERHVEFDDWEVSTEFDIVRSPETLIISLYDEADHHRFLGQVRDSLLFDPRDDNSIWESHHKLQPRNEHDTEVSGQISTTLTIEKTAGYSELSVLDFEILMQIGSGEHGQVYQVRKKDTKCLYAMKAHSKNFYSEPQAVLERVKKLIGAKKASPFTANFKFQFQTPKNLYFVVDFISGGELFYHLQKQGRFKEDWTRFYIAEIALGLEYLHQGGFSLESVDADDIIIDSTGHAVVSCLGLLTRGVQKGEAERANAQNPSINSALEYSAPELIIGKTKGRTDFWSLGVLMFQMICGWSPFYTEDRLEMIKNICFGTTSFPHGALSFEGRAFLKKLIDRNPEHRLGYQRGINEIKEQPWMAKLDWEQLASREMIPPFNPRQGSQEDYANMMNDGETNLHFPGLPGAYESGLSSGPKTADSGYMSARISAASRLAPFKYTPSSTSSMAELGSEFQSLSLVAGTTLKDPVFEDINDDEGFGEGEGINEMDMDMDMDTDAASEQQHLLQYTSSFSRSRSRDLSTSDSSAYPIISPDRNNSIDSDSP